jgi:hypothetical protein
VTRLRKKWLIRSSKIKTSNHSRRPLYYSLLSPFFLFSAFPPVVALALALFKSPLPVEGITFMGARPSPAVGLVCKGISVLGWLDEEEGCRGIWWVTIGVGDVTPEVLEIGLVTEGVDTRGVPEAFSREDGDVTGAGVFCLFEIAVVVDVVADDVGAGAGAAAGVEEVVGLESGITDGMSNSGGRTCDKSCLFG